MSVAEVTAFGDFTAALVDSFETSLPGLGGAASGRIEGAFLEAGEQGFRVLVVSEDDSAQMVGRGGVEWVREEALAAADQARNHLFFCSQDSGVRFALHVSTGGLVQTLVQVNFYRVSCTPNPLQLSHNGPLSTTMPPLIHKCRLRCRIFASEVCARNWGQARRYHKAARPEKAPPTR